MMKVLYCLRNINIFNYHESIIENLSDNGHIVKIIFSNNNSVNENSMDPNPEERINNLNNVSFKYLSPKRNLIQKINFITREIKNYQRYFNRSYKEDSQHSFYQERWAKYLPIFIRFIFTKIPIFKLNVAIRLAEALFNFIEKLSGSPRTHKKIINDFGPDIIIGSPGNLRYSEEIDFIKYGKSKNILTILFVLTWDNLTTKGGFNIIPDKFFAWNKYHENELIKHHKIDKTKIEICGSPFFDKWFSKKYENYNANSFNKVFNITKDDRYLIYLGSSSNLGRNDGEVINEILKKLKKDLLKNVILIIKPHLTNQSYLKNFEGMDNVRLWKNDYSKNWIDNQAMFKFGLLNAVCTIGLNTTAMIDSVINGCQVVSIIFNKNIHEPTNSAIHFKTMIEAKVYNFIDNFNDFEYEIINISDYKEAFDNKRKNFIKNFVRPIGINVEVGEIVRAKMENLLSKSNENN